MTDNKEQVKNNEAARAGVIGAVVGAGVAFAATKALSDQKTRKKVVQAIGNMKDKMNDAKHRLQSAEKEVKKEK